MATPLEHRSVRNTGGRQSRAIPGTYRIKGQPVPSLSRVAGSSGDGTLREMHVRLIGLDRQRGSRKPRREATGQVLSAL